LSLMGRSKRVRIAAVGFCITLAAVTPGGNCQVQEWNDFQTWADIRTVYNFTEKFAYDGDQGTRGILSAEDWDLLYFRPSVKYKWTKHLSLRGGVGGVFLFEEINSTELRPWQGLQIFWPVLSELKFDQYVRLEQRFVDLRRTGTGYQFTLRLRYRVRARSRPRPLLGIPTPTFGMIAYEVFFNLESIIPDSDLKMDRFYAGVGNDVTSKWTVQLHYIYIRLRGGDGLGINATDHVLRMRLTYIIH
jgi:hypothetical protein